MAINNDSVDCRRLLFVLDVGNVMDDDRNEAKLCDPLNNACLIVQGVDEQDMTLAVRVQLRESALHGHGTDLRGDGEVELASVG